MRRNTDLAIVAVGTVAAALVTGADVDVSWLRVLAGVPLVLVLPGYALSVIAAPDRVPHGFSPVLWRGLWIAGLSLAASVLGGLVLNLTPAGLTRVSWAILLAAVTLLALAAVGWLRARSPAARPAAPPAARQAGRPALAVAGYGVAALALAGTATGLAVVSGGWQHSPPFAQLWLVPGAGAGNATLGVRSAYSAAQEFRLVLKNGTHQAGTWTFTLDHGQTWQRTVTATPGQRLTAELTTGLTPGGQARTETVAVTA